MIHPPYSDLQNYCDGALTGEQLDAVRVHLHSCQRCSAVVAQEQAMIRALQNSEHAAPGPDFDQRVLSQLFPHGRGLSTDRRWQTRYVATITGIAATVAVLLLSASMGGEAANTRTSMFDKLGDYLAPLFNLIPLPEFRIDNPLNSAYGETIEVFAAVICVLLFLAALDRFVLQPLIKPRPRISRNIAPGMRDQ